MKVMYEARLPCGGCSKITKAPSIYYFFCLFFFCLAAANIVIQTEPATVASIPGSNVSRFNTDQDNRKRTMGPSTTEGPAAKKPWMEK